jgi:tRNA-2-methylthio-N6-dimethylallyladenosine synthase
MPDQIAADVVQERYERLIALVNDVAWTENRFLLGSAVEVLIARGEGRKDGTTARVSGRAKDNRLVHVAKPNEEIAPGDFVTARVTHAAPHHLVADDVVSVRRTRSTAQHSVGLGMPAMPVG